jgi:hypothetical protein
MQRVVRTALLSVCLTLVASYSVAQNGVDIGLYQNNGVLEVKVRPETDFAGIFSSVVFTIRWDANSGASLSTSEQEGASAEYIALARSGTIREEGGFRYAVYAGFGMTPMSNHGVNWQAGKEYTIATIPVQGKGEFELVNDAYTAERSNNANFYASLGGTDRTGIIYKGLAAAEEDGSVLIQPNPNNGRFVLSFTNEPKGDVTVEMVNSIGQTVFNETVRDLQGAYKKEMDLTNQSAGAYYVKIKRGGNVSTHKVIYR